MKGRPPLLALASCLLPFALASCGYHVASTTDVLPKNVKTIAIPAFGNITTRYKISDLLAAAITREFISRTRYQIVFDPDQADAVLTGSVDDFVSYPLYLDPQTGRAAGIQPIVTMQVTLRDPATNAARFDR